MRLQKNKINLLLFNLATDADDPVLGFTTSWIQALARHCDIIHVITMRQGRLELPDNVKVYSVGKEKGYSEPRRAFEFYRHLIRILANNRIDACFAHMIPLFVVMGAPLLKIKDIPIILWYAHRHVSLMLKLAEKLVNKIVTSTPEGCRLSSDKIEVIGQGINTTQFYCENRKPSFSSKYIKLLYVGRISPIKHIETLIEAVGYLRRNHSIDDIAVYLVGDTAVEGDLVYRDQLQKQIERLGVKDCIYFVGSVKFSELPKWYCSADVSYNGSPKGALDKSVLESMSCEVPVFVSNESFRDIMGEYADQLIFPQGDYVRLAEQILAFIKLAPEERQVIGLKLREGVVSGHSLDRLARILVEVFQC